MNSYHSNDGEWPDQHPAPSSLLRTPHNSNQRHTNRRHHHHQQHPSNHRQQQQNKPTSSSAAAATTTTTTSDPNSLSSSFSQAGTAVGFIASQIVALTDNFFSDGDHINGNNRVSRNVAEAIDYGHFFKEDGIVRPTDPSIRHWLLSGERVLIKVENVGYLRSMVEPSDEAHEEESETERAESNLDVMGSVLDRSYDIEDEYYYHDESDTSSDDPSDHKSHIDLRQGAVGKEREGSEERDQPLDDHGQQSRQHSNTSPISIGGDDNLFDMNNIDAIDLRNRKLNRYLKSQRLQTRQRKGGHAIRTHATRSTGSRNVLLGSLFITNYQIRFSYLQQTLQPLSCGNDLNDNNNNNNSTDATEQQRQQEDDITPIEFIASTPLSSILKVEERFPQNEMTTGINSVFYGCTKHIAILGKDFQFINLLFYNNTSSNSNNICRQIDYLLYPQTVDRLFAFEFGRETLSLLRGRTHQHDENSSSASVSDEELHVVNKTIAQICNRFTMNHIKNGWKVYNMQDEFQRQGVLENAGSSEKWRITEANSDFQICSTYPRQLLVPRTVDDTRLKQSSTFRSKGRIPVLTWQHPNQMSCIMRSSQPMVGISGSRCAGDEELMASVLNVMQAKKLYIIDARPRANAMANTVMGKGYENTKYYIRSELEFLNIENIHAMTRSLNALRNLCQKPTDLYWLSNMESSGWLRHMKQLIAGANRIVDLVHREKCPVLVHCSDGWDRTSQLCALAQLLMDPYYRTIRGFQVLIEKDWVSFGFKFLDRCGHVSKGSSSEYSPIFMQWIECVWHIWQQYPSTFEFNETFLITLTDHVYSSLFGNFLHNSVRERENQNVHRTTISLWTYINSDLDRYRNPFYKQRRVVPNTTKCSTSVGAVQTQADNPNKAIVDVLPPPPPPPLPPSHQVQVLVPDMNIPTLLSNFWTSYYFRFVIDTKSKGLLRKFRREYQRERDKNTRMERDLAKMSRKLRACEKYFMHHNIATPPQDVRDSSSQHKGDSALAWATIENYF